jgi:hypothetical protein
VAARVDDVAMTSQSALSVLALNEDQVTPGLLGFLVVAALGVATWFLIKSMNKQLKKIDFDESKTQVREERDGARNPTDDEH